MATVAVCTLILFFGADLALRWVSSSNWMKKYAVQKMQEATGREVRLEKMSVSFMGVKADKFALSEAGGFEKGTFLSVERLRIRVSLIHLVHGHIKLKSLTVSGVEAYLLRRADHSLECESEVDPFPVKADVTSEAEVRERRPEDFAVIFSVDDLGGTFRVSEVHIADVSRILRPHTCRVVNFLLGLEETIASIAVPGVIFSTLLDDLSGRDDFLALNVAHGRDIIGQIEVHLVGEVSHCVLPTDGDLPTVRVHLA